VLSSNYGFLHHPRTGRGHWAFAHALGQGAISQNITVTGTNTNWVNGITVANFGPGITVKTAP